MYRAGWYPILQKTKQIEKKKNTYDKAMQITWKAVNKKENMTNYHIKKFRSITNKYKG